MRASVLAVLAIATTVVLASKLAEANRRLDKRTAEVKAFEELNDNLIKVNDQLRSSITNSKDSITGLLASMGRVMTVSAGGSTLPRDIDDNPGSDPAAQRIHNCRKFVALSATEQIMRRNARPAKI